MKFHLIYIIYFIQNIQNVKGTSFINLRDSTPRNTPTKISLKRLLLDSKNVSTSSITTDLETSPVKNWSTPSEPSGLKAKPPKSSILSTPHHNLKRWTSEVSLEFLDSAENKTANLHWVNCSKHSTQRNKELSALNNSKSSLNQ